MICDDCPTEDRRRWQIEVDSFVQQKFEDPLETSATQKSRMQNLRADQLALEQRGIPTPTLHTGILMATRARLTRGKAAGSDNISADIILATPTVALYFVLFLFAQRLVGSWHEDVPSCGVVLLYF